MVALAVALNYLLSFLFWFVVGRLVLGMLVGSRPNLVMSLFRRGTDPLFAAVRRVTPSFVADRYLPWLTLVLLLALRVLLLPFLRADSPS